MIQSDKTKYTDILNNSINYLQQLGFEDIKADADGYETPKSYSKLNSDIVVIPDIVAQKEGRKHIFELSLKSDEPKLLKSKWLFLDTLSKMKSYRFGLITTRGHIKFTNDMMNDLNLEGPKLIKI
ncbi:hypothetical protein FJ651_02095 [Paucihalobacter ruber]|uniref:Uncharacterized protein n=1 Tax=Paucihalobacter ruber TaxID=2567861 RepID=A0A506PR22_9FLAO|nr:hypothetical protein [Paucihalobacter ruber]TPV35727.1 hypothetical protein FJ651_02095 [Paucihalobacter ruber]